MSFKTFVALALLALFVRPAALAAEQPKAVDLLFESKQLELMKKGSQAVYNFERKVSDERILGKDQKDEIKLNVLNINDKGEREVEIKIFTGDQARDPSSWPDLTINPLFLWYLNRSVTNFAMLGGGDQQYLKSRIKAAFRDSAKVEAVKADFDGKPLDAYRVTVTPFKDDRSSSKMQGFEGAQFTVVVSKDAPGYFMALGSLFESTSATAPRLEENIALVGLGEAK